MTDKMQEEFEEWALTECFDLTAVGGFYSDNETDAAYKAWQAARTVLNDHVNIPNYLTKQLLNVDWLSNVIRAVDGNNSLGAGALAEAIIEEINKTTCDHLWNAAKEIPGSMGTAYIVKCIKCGITPSHTGD